MFHGGIIIDNNYIIEFSLHCIYNAVYRGEMQA